MAARFCMVEIKRKNGESIESLLRRFTRRMQQSKVLIRAKEERYFQKKKTKRELHEGALRRKQIKEKKEYLKKIGKLEETDKYKRR
ncbi:30S ribosomal protein S21 [Candidatus Falkowbacteria bacterium]|nr:30S ribosomal protein S21 [Candidatus Falkowbacteria bacterium]